MPSSKAMPCKARSCLHQLKFTLRASIGTADADVEDRLRALEKVLKQSSQMSNASEGEVTEVRVSDDQQSTRLVNIPLA